MVALKNLVRNVIILLISGVGLTLAYLAFTGSLGTGIVVPLIAIAGIVCLLLVSTLVTVIFAKFGLADKAQALALPEGSVRAVIALALVVLFAIISIFLFGTLATGEGSIRRLIVSTAVADGIVSKSMQSDSKVEILSVVPGKGTTTIRYRSRVSPEAADFAKQLLTLLGTLLTAVSSFYFGARTVAATQDAMSGSATPTVTSVTPAQVASNAGTVQVTIFGSGLERTKGVKLSNASRSVEGTVVQNSSCALIYSFAISPDMEGPWELVVTGDGDPVRKPFTVTPAVAPA